MPQSQWIAVLIAALVAFAVLVRLYMVLGRRGGAEPQPQPPGWARTPVPAAPPATLAPPAPEAPGLADVRRAEPGFDAGKFLEGARAAYRQIVTAFEKGDEAALKPLLSADVLAGFAAAIAARGAAPAAYLFSDLKDAEIVSGAVDGTMLEITVRFTAAFDAPGTVGAPHEIADIWTFARAAGAADPNWTLVATSGETA